MKLGVKLFLALVVQALAALAAVTPPVLAPVALSELGLGTDAWLGVYIALLYLAAMASTLLSGDLIARLGPIRVSQYALALCTVGICAIALGAPLFLAFAPLLIGFGYGLITPAGSQILVTGKLPRSMGLVVSVKQTGVPLGGMLAGLIIPFLIQLTQWRFAIGFVASLCVLMVLALQLWRPGFDRDRDVARAIKLKKLSGSMKSLRNSPEVFRLASCSFLFAAMQLCVITFLVAYLANGLDQSLIVAGALLSVAQVGGIAGRIGWGWLTDFSINATAVLVLLAILMSGTAISLGFLRVGVGWYWVASVVFILGATAIGWNGVFLAEVARLAPQADVGAVTGAALFLTYSGVVIGPPIFSLTLGITGSYAASFDVIALCVFIGSISLLTKGSVPRRH